MLGRGKCRGPTSSKKKRSICAQEYSAPQYTQDQTVLAIDRDRPHCHSSCHSHLSHCPFPDHSSHPFVIFPQAFTNIIFYLAETRWRLMNQYQWKIMSMKLPVAIVVKGELQLTGYCSYEGLPPNFSLGYNMLAGAFAGIMVSLHILVLHSAALLRANRFQEHTAMYPVDLLKVCNASPEKNSALTDRRLVCKSSTLLLVRFTPGFRMQCQLSPEWKAYGPCGKEFQA